MEREASAATSRPQGRQSSNQLHVQHDGRKPLFFTNRTNAKDGSDIVQPGPSRVSSGASTAATDRAQPKTSGLAHRIQSEPDTAAAADRKVSSGSTPSTGNTRLPRGGSSATARRGPLTLTEAYKLAGGEDLEQPDNEQPVDGSPSPAPRPIRSRNGSNDTQLRHMLNEDHLDTKGRNRQSPIRRALEDGRGRDGNRSSPLARSKTVPGEHTHGANDLPDLVPGIEDVPLQSVEAGSPARRDPMYTSPEKSFAWQVDEDFTAGDLQISDSPRIKVGNRPFSSRPSLLDDRSRLRTSGAGRNTKLDEIRERERQTGGIGPFESRPRPFGTKLDEIRAREAEVDQRMPMSERRLSRPRNTKLDDIMQREANGLSRRALAAARLQEIKEQNAMSRSLSPDDSRLRPRRGSEADDLLDAGDRGSRLPVRPSSAFGVGGERIPDTPVTVYKSRQLHDRVAERAPLSRGLGGYQRSSDSRDLLRQLARAASSSPAAEHEVNKPASPAKARTSSYDKPSSRLSSLGRLSDNDRKSAIRDPRDNGSTRPTVGFAGLRRRSSDSTKSKRSSMHSEGDPVDRIASEIKLFALQDNYSERGSVRAPSPLPEADDPRDLRAEDATPRPIKQDPLTMPTPRVSGAYVETPATVKMAKPEKTEPDKVDKAKGGREARDKEVEKEAKQQEPASDSTAIFLDKIKRLAWRKKGEDTASDPGAAAKDEATTASTTASKKARAQSLPRRRPQPKNSAKPHSVRDDLLELQRAHNLDDSTLDDFEEILSGRKPSPSALDAVLKDLALAVEEEEQEKEEEDEDVAAGAQMVKREHSEKPAVFEEEKVKELGQTTKSVDDEDERAAFDRMSKSLRTGLLGIRSAKQGIERLEDRFANTQNKPQAKLGKTTKTQKHQLHAHSNADSQESCPICAGKGKARTVTYLHLPVPRLYYRTPSFRFTLLGLVLFLLSLWYTTETAMCAAYCRPTTCSSVPCIWSYDDPTFGSAVPVKVDQWLTGGYGRMLANDAREELEDWVADMLDMAHGRELTADSPTEHLSFEQKRRHRRRLRKRGLLKPPADPSPEDQARWESWRRTRMAKERAREVRELGYGGGGGGYGYGYDDDYDDTASVGGDERVW